VHTFWPEAIAVYMQGLPTPSRVDPKGKRAGWQSEVHTQGDRDLEFVDAVLKTIRERHTVDDDRIYAAGLSNGGGFTYVLWAARPDVFAAYAPCAAILHGPEKLKLKLKPRAIFHIAGETDHTAPFELQEQSMAKVREINHCQDSAVVYAPGCKLYAPRDESGAPFVSLIHPGGHGAPPHTFELMIRFFKEHPRPSGSPEARTKPARKRAKAR
jgi:polyhydroxybutyrate depolymerase